MRQQFIETIKIADGQVLKLPYHQARMTDTIGHFFPSTAVPSLESLLCPTPCMTLYKARVLYGAQGVEDIQYSPYTKRVIRSLRIVEDNSIDYPYKSTCRTRLNQLAAMRGEQDEVIIVKRGFVTDTSFSNIALLEHGRWVTPKHPLLPGTQRARLLHEGILQEDDITPERLMQAEAVALINAMLALGDTVVKPKNIRWRIAP